MVDRVNEAQPRVSVAKRSQPDESQVPDGPTMLTLTDLVRQAAAEVGREDLVQRLTHTRERLEDKHVRVIVVGEFKQGKSKLINALVNAPICPVDDDLATSVPTSVGYGPEPHAWVLTRPRNGEGNTKVVRQEVPIEKLAEYVSEQGNPGNRKSLVGAEAVLPREILTDGLYLVDSPGVGGLDSSSALSTLFALSSAHAVLLVSDASQEYTEPELQFLKHATRVSPNVAAVLSKTDLYPQWRDIEQIDEGHLREVGDIPIFAISSDLRLLAASHHDSELNEESGFPELVAHLRNNIVQQAELLALRSAVHDLSSVLNQVLMVVKAQLEAVRSPKQIPQFIGELERAKSRAEEFRSKSSRWQVALNDGVQDLVSDMEHDLRDRLRRVQREAEDAIDKGDPGPIWDELTEWVDKRVAASISETFVWLNERSQWLLEEVADLFLEEERALPAEPVDDAAALLDDLEQIGDLDPERLSAAEKIYIGVRGSYGGLLIVGLATGLIGLSLINPISLTAGVLVGKRAYKEDMKARLGRRRFEAKSIVRRYIDEVTFQMSKELKDRLRLLQRTARDHFSNLVDELTRSLNESMNAAKQAANEFSTEQERSIEHLSKRAVQLENLRARIPELPPALGFDAQTPKRLEPATR